MKRNRLAAAATGLLAVGLVFGSTPAASAKVTAKDVPSKGDIVKAFPELNGGTFKVVKSKKVAEPGKKCGTTKALKVKSAVTNTGVSSVGFPVVTTGVAEFKSTAQAKKYLAKYKKFVKRCKSYTESTTGFTVTLKKAKAPKVGQDRIAVVQTTSGSGLTIHGSSVVIRHGKRIGEVTALDDAKVGKKSIAKLAKVTAKKMK